MTGNGSAPLIWFSIGEPIGIVQLLTLHKILIHLVEVAYWISLQAHAIDVEAGSIFKAFTRDCEKICKSLGLPYKVNYPTLDQMGVEPIVGWILLEVNTDYHYQNSTHNELASIWFGMG